MSHAWRMGLHARRFGPGKDGPGSRLGTYMILYSATDSVCLPHIFLGRMARHVLACLLVVSLV